MTYAINDNITASIVRHAVEKVLGNKVIDVYVNRFNYELNTEITFVLERPEVFGKELHVKFPDLRDRPPEQVVRAAVEAALVHLPMGCLPKIHSRKRGRRNEHNSPLARGKLGRGLRA